MKPPRWIKRGIIFRPQEHSLPFGCRDFAQSPQALVMDDRVRIFFSTRSVDDTTGKFFSHVCYADFDTELRELIDVCDHPVLPLGGLGCFDEHGIFPISPLRVSDQIYGYTCGWSRRSAVSVETGIGLAISDDNGKSFRRIGDGPVLSATLHEPCLVGDGFVRFYEGRFHMWYIYGLPWKQYDDSPDAQRIYKIAHAISDNGIDWDKTGGEQLIADQIGSDECQALPTVIEHQGRYHMYFCFRYANDFRTNPKRAYRLGYAYSDNLRTWVRDDQMVGIERSDLKDDWDSEMMCYPNVFSVNEKLFLLYNGNKFGREGFGVAVAESDAFG
ncbi:hypothetical protein LOC67_15855 [Stieleria sp. JC731]|uniref:hypothetical protein n=1 Tax=Pirellulaceae TaxID=2691357 RepID=UPI001E4CB804|nr:hypothetical protein [Stieleria sp. JC731]MCC9602037.1 hypothetical protein [Stieleria sp. JC731]